MQKSKELKNTFYYLLPSIVMGLLQLISLPVFTRVLSVEDFGALALCQVYALFINSIANFGLSIGYERNFFESNDSVKKAGLLYATILFIVATSFIFGIGTYLFKEQISFWITGRSGYDNLLVVAYCAIALTTIKSYYLIYLKNSERAKSFVWYTIDDSLLGFVFSICFLFVIKTGVIGIVFGQLVAGICVFSVLTFRFLKELPFAVDLKALKEGVKLSVPLTPKLLFSTVGNQVDKYILGLLSNVGGVGIYSLGQRISHVVFVGMTAIQNVWSPKVYKNMFEMKSEGGPVIGKYLTPFLYYSIAIGLLVAVFSEEAITILTPSNYHGAIDIAVIFSMLFGLYFFAKQPQLIYAKKTALISFVSVISVVGNLLLIPPFIKVWGMFGAAWAALLSGSIYVFFTFVISQKQYRIDWEYRKIVPIFFLFFFAGVLLIVLRHAEVNYQIRLTIKIIFIFAYAYLGVIIGVITHKDYLMIRNFLKLKPKINLQ
jgi:O-antigen/teichoic acid export membrane protein